MAEILYCKNRIEFREWLKQNYNTKEECYIVLKRGKPISKDVFYYIDAVEEALCFGWIDSTLTLIDGIYAQRFSPRKSNLWTELNKARVERLTRLGLMTPAGLKVCSKEKFVPDIEVINKLKESGVYETFCTFPELYQRIRLYNVAFYKNKDKTQYIKALNNLIKNTKNGKMYGEWNDYGRLI